MRIPKYAIHHIILLETIKKLKQSFVPAERDIGTLIENNLQAAVMGCVAPDMFFWSPDYEVVRIPLKLYENFEWLVDLYNNTIGKLKEAISHLADKLEEAMDKVAPATTALIKTLIVEFKESADLFKKNLQTGLFDGVLAISDVITDLADVPDLMHAVFDTFIPPLQGGDEEEKWYWFDMIHYRYTGEFAKNLQQLASSGTDLQKAFAYGWLTHLAGDVTGHPYVNQIVGGPYRTHAQRHATCENFMDAWKFYHYWGENINQELHDKMNFPKDLPEEIVTLLDDTLHATYADKLHPNRINKGAPHNGFLTKEDIRDTWDIFIFVMEVLGGLVPEEPEEPFTDVIDILDEALEQFTAPPSPPSHGDGVCSAKDIFSFGLTSKSRECYKAMAEAIEDWFEYIGELLEWTFETLLSLVDFLLAALLTLPVMAVVAILYGIQLVLYRIYRELRWPLVLSGLCYPEPDELDTSHSRNLISPYQCEVKPFTDYPRTHDCNYGNLECPGGHGEKPFTAPGWYPLDDPSITPDRFIHEEPFGLAGVERMKKYASAAEPEITRQLQKSGGGDGGVAALKPLGPIGNAIDFAAWIIANSSKHDVADIVFCDWNWDADRGIGYHCFKATFPAKGPNYEITDETYEIPLPEE